MSARSFSEKILSEYTALLTDSDAGELHTSLRSPQLLLGLAAAAVIADIIDDLCVEVREK